MDISRPDLKAKKRRRQALTIAIGVVLLAGITFLVMRLKPAAPTVDRSVVWTDIVKRGPMVRQVRGLGTLVPREDAIRQIPAQSEATVVRILTLPGSDVKADTVLMELSDPQLSQEALDAELSLRSARADLSNVQVKVQSDLMAQKSTAATVNADYKQAQRQAQIDKSLYSLGVISGLAYSGSQGTADQLSTRDKLQEQTVEINEKAVESQLAVQQAKVAQAEAIYELKKQQLDALKVRAGIAGVLTDMPLAVGQHVTMGTMLAQVVVRNQLKAQLKIAETQARDIEIGQPASIDTHNGLADGIVSRIDPAVQNGTVTVDVKLVGALPEGRQFPQHSWNKVFNAVFLGASMQIPSLLQLEAECCHGALAKRIGKISDDTIGYALQRQSPEPLFELGCTIARQLKQAARQSRAKPQVS